MARAARDASALDVHLAALERLRPGHPALHFARGELHGSAGEHLRFRRALAAFQQFLDTTAETVLRDSQLARAEVVSSICRLSFAGRRRDLQEIRWTARQHMKQLEDERSLLLVTPTRTIVALAERTERELAERAKIIHDIRAQIASLESRVAVAAGDPYVGDIGVAIRSLEDRVLGEEWKVRFVEAELTRLRAAVRERGDAPAPTELVTDR